MNEIKKTDINTTVEGVTLSKNTKVSPAGVGKPDPSQQKTMTVEVDFTGAVIADVFEYAMKNLVISQVNGTLRKNQTTLPDNYVHKMKFIDLGVRAPRIVEDPYITLTREATERGITLEVLMAEKAAQFNR